MELRRGKKGDYGRGRERETSIMRIWRLYIVREGGRNGE